ncbi:MAG: hypothetical protein ACYDCX_11525 [Acidithiobacillus sp.]
MASMTQSGGAMSGSNSHQEGFFSYLSPEAQALKRHPRRPDRAMLDQALTALMGAATGLINVWHRLAG